MGTWLKRGALVTVSFCAIGTVVFWFGVVQNRELNHEAERPPEAGPVVEGRAEPRSGEPQRWLAFGGGWLPDSNQVSIEQDLGLAVELFGRHGRLLYAGGPGTDGVQVLDDTLEGEPLMADLAELFSPRPGRDARYRITELEPDGDATLDSVEAAVRDLVEHGGRDVLIYVAAHGERGNEPAANGVVLWGGALFSVIELASILDTAPPERTVRAVVTSCFSGGFGELAFEAADAELGIPAADRCGLFAATWDEPSSGCDPNPDRRAQQGYGVHFLNALRGLDRDGNRLSPREVDFDGDADVSLLEAHARVRIVSESIDIPTTTSERWLRYAAPKRGRLSKLDLPEEDAVISALAMKLGLAADLEAAFGALEQLDASFTEAVAQRDAAQREEEDVSQVAIARVLARWPVLDDPWHPLFGETLSRNRVEIERHLEQSSSIQRLRTVAREVDRRTAEVERLRAGKAPLERLVRALENRVLAGRLKRRGGRDWKTYERLLTCERWVPRRDRP